MYGNNYSFFDPPVQTAKKHLKILLGGSPCTHWSIAQRKDRETTASGIGWELFKNYLYARDKFKPDYFLYENNKSAAQPIKDQISKELGVNLQYINSALVSAQNRQRFYAHNIPNVSQPADRGILLKDILESGTDLSQNEKSYSLTTRCQGAIPEDTIQKHRHSVVAEPVIFQEPSGFNKGGIKYDKSPTMTTSAWEQNNKIVEPIRIGTIESGERSLKSDSQANRVYSPYAKSVTLLGQGGGAGAKTGLYACPVSDNVAVFTLPHGYQQGIMSYDKSPTLTTGTAIRQQNPVIVPYQGEELDETKYKIINKIYQVLNGLITIKDKQYHIKLPDGYYIIRKLTVLECKRLQTVRDDYIFPVSNSQAYKMLGNGWTVEVIKHILSYIPNIADCTVEVLSMYDGMSCGNLALEGLGCNVIRYDAYEIDKYAIQTTQTNFPYVIQKGDAFQVRNYNWKY